MHPPANKRIHQHDYKDIYEITEMLITKWDNIFADKCGIVELESFQSKTGCRKVCFTESPENDPITLIETNFTPKLRSSINKLSQFKSNSVSDTESSDEDEDLTTIKSIKISLSPTKPLVQEESPIVLVFFYVLIVSYVTLMFTSFLF